MKKVDIKKYTSLCRKACLHFGFNEQVSSVTSRLLVRTDMFGIYTHGTFGLKPYLEKVPAGGMDAAAAPEVAVDGPSYAIVEGHNGMPIYNSYYGVKVGMEKAASTGVAYVGIRGSGHCGACGVYTVEAAEKGFIALFMSTSSNCMSIPGGKGRAIGNSPLSYAIPAGEHRPVFMDIALSHVAGTKITRLKLAGEPVPEGWIYDCEGNPTTDYNKPYAFAPMAGHKGYCLSFMVEALCAVLTGGGILGEQKLWSKPEAVADLSHCCILIDVDKLMDRDMFADRMRQAIEELASTPRVEGCERIWLPGEMEWANYERAEREGLLIPDDIIGRMSVLAEKTGQSLASCYID